MKDEVVNRQYASENDVFIYLIPERWKILKFGIHEGQSFHVIWVHTWLISLNSKH
jgi:hypothetical protein